MASEAEGFELRARRNGVKVIEVEGLEGAADAIASHLKEGSLVAVEGNLTVLKIMLGERGLRVMRLEELDPEALLRLGGAAAVRVAAGVLPDTGSVVLTGSSRPQLILPSRITCSCCWSANCSEGGLTSGRW